MAQRKQDPAVTARLAERMQTDDKTAVAWLDGITETLYEAIQSGECVTLPGLGVFYVKPTPDTWIFRFNPAQRLRAALGWSSTYKGSH